MSASDPDPNSLFGWAVSVNGSTAVVGSSNPFQCDKGDNCGSAYVIRFDGTDWVETQKLIAHDRDPSDPDAYGSSVFVSGDRALVGAYQDDCADGEACGSAYMFRFDGTEWVEEQKLTASDAEEADHFGSSLCVDGETAFVGVPRDWCSDNSAYACGSVYVFRLEGGGWVEKQKLGASDGASFDYFGESVSVNGNTAVIGAALDDCDAGESCGSAYVFRFNGTEWVEEQKLTAQDAGVVDQFGASVSVDGDRILIGAFQDDCASGTQCGSAYVFHFDGTSWSEEQKLTASDAEKRDFFGASVSLSGDTALLGASLADCISEPNCGAVYRFRFDGTSWREEQKLTGSGTPFFGTSVSLAGATALVGASGTDCSDTGFYGCGSAHFFRCEGPSCDQTQELTASDAENRDMFGSSVSVSGDTMVVGAREDDCATEESCGSAYVYRFNGIGWSFEQKLTASGADTLPSFGASVSTGADTVIVGEPFADCPAGLYCGAAYVYRFNGTSWVKEQELTAVDAAAVDFFGTTISLSGNTIVVGAPADNFAAGSDCGSAYVYRFNGTDWVLEQKLFASDAAANDFFGISVSVSGDTTFVAADRDDCAGGADCGSVYVFRFNGTFWVEEDKLTASDAEAGDRFGISLALSGSTAFVGAYQDRCAAGGNCGSAYVYRFNGTSWVEEQKLTASDAAADALFGLAVAVSGDAAVIGGSRDDCVADVSCGLAYLFRFDGTDWVEDQKLTAIGAGAGGDTSRSFVAISGDTVVVGSDGDDCVVGPDCGSAYVFGCLGLVSAPPPHQPDPTGIDKPRFVSFAIEDSGQETALRIGLVSLHHVDPPYTGGASVPFTAFEGQVRWVGPPTQYLESVSSGTPFFASQLQWDPSYQDWSTVGLLHVTGSAIVPSSIYEVENVAASCMGSEASCTAVSAPLSISTTRWGDVVDPFNPPSSTTQPDFADIGALVNKFKSAAGAPIKARALLAETNANGEIDPTPDLGFTHISACVDAFKGLPYPYQIAGCP